MINLAKMKRWSRNLIICGVAAFCLTQAVDWTETMVLKYQISVRQEMQQSLENLGCKVNLELDGLFNKERTVRYTYNYRNNSGKDIKNLKGHFIIFGVNGSKEIESQTFDITNLRTGEAGALEQAIDIEQTSYKELFKKDLPIQAEQINAETANGLLDSVGIWFRSKLALFEQKAETVSYNASFVVDEIEYADGKVVKQPNDLVSIFYNFINNF